MRDSVPSARYSNVESGSSQLIESTYTHGMVYILYIIESVDSIAK